MEACPFGQMALSVNAHTTVAFSGYPMSSFQSPENAHAAMYSQSPT
jgi:hypothetical protein